MQLIFSIPKLHVMGLQKKLTNFFAPKCNNIMNNVIMRLHPVYGKCSKILNTKVSVCLF